VSTRCFFLFFFMCPGSVYPSRTPSSCLFSKASANAYNLWWASSPATPFSHLLSSRMGPSSPPTSPRRAPPHGTTMLMTEGGIQEGKLVERGVLNVRAIQQVMSTQTLAYKFPFSEFSFPTDIGFVILAQGTKSAFFQV
jgi:Mini-chromosome maintenance replisome factor